MNRIVAVIVMTFRRLMRNRLLVVGAVMALFVVGLQASVMAHAMRLRAAGRPEIAADALLAVFPQSLGLLGFFAQLIALVVGSSVVRRDVVDGTLTSVLAKPVSRGEYLTGTVAGGALYIVLVWGIFTTVLGIAMALVGLPMGSTHAVAVAAKVSACMLAYGITVLFSMRCNPWVAGAAAVLVMQGPAITNGVLSLAGEVFDFEVPERLVEALVLPFPLISMLDPATDALFQGTLSPRPLWPAFVHVLHYATVAVVCAWLFFRRLELNQMRD